MFEASAIGWKFMLTRFLVDIPGIAIIAYLTEKLMNKSEKELVYQNVSKYSGVAPITYSSGQKVKQLENRQGNRTLYGIFHLLAI